MCWLAGQSTLKGRREELEGVEVTGPASCLQLSVRKLEVVAGGRGWLIRIGCA